MPKILKASFPEKCIGCELCVAEAQHQLKKIGLEGALIRIFRNRTGRAIIPSFYIEIDPRIKNLDMETIKKVCPRAVFEITQNDDTL